MKLRWFLSVCIFVCLTYRCYADLYFTTIPSSIKLQTSHRVLKNEDISRVVNYLMGLSTSRTNSWEGVEQLDIFNRPKANLLIDLRIPTGASYSMQDDKFVAMYWTSGNGELSLEETNRAIVDSFSDETSKPMCLELDRVQKDFFFSGVNYNIPLSNRLIFEPQVVAHLNEMKDHLITSQSILSSLQPSCLNATQQADAIFLSELQTLKDVLAELTGKSAFVTKDNLPDNFHFTLTGLQDLAQTYGVQSCQVVTALEILETFIPQFANDLNELYAGQLLSELNIAGPRQRDFEVIRNRRATDAEPIGNVAEPTMTDYAIVINLFIWITVIFALASLASAYYIWFMDPGWDSIIYRMTSFRIKME